MAAPRKNGKIPVFFLHDFVVKIPYLLHDAGARRF